MFLSFDFASGPGQVAWTVSEGEVERGTVSRWGPLGRRGIPTPRPPVEGRDVDLRAE